MVQLLKVLLTLLEYQLHNQLYHTNTHHEIMHGFCLGTGVPRHRDGVVRLYVCTSLFNTLICLYEINESWKVTNVSLPIINWQTTIATATAESCVVAVKFTYFTVWSSITWIANALIRLIAEASHWSCMEHSITSLIIRFSQ